MTSAKYKQAQEKGLAMDLWKRWGIWSTGKNHSRSINLPLHKLFVSLTFPLLPGATSLELHSTFHEFLHPIQNRLPICLGMCLFLFTGIVILEDRYIRLPIIF